MTGFVGAAPEELDEFVRAARAVSEREREVLRRLERALEALGPVRRQLGPAADNPTRSLRTVAAQADALAADVASVALSYWAADQILIRLGAAATGSAGSGSSEGASTLLPAPDVSVEWSWPPEWTIDGRWGDSRGFVEAEAGLGARAEAGAGVAVTRDSIRVGGYADARVGAWAGAAIGSAIGPFAGRAEGEVFVGAQARAEALLHVGRDGARAHLGGEAFAGAKAEGDVRVGVGPVQAGAHGSVSYGIGYTADADIDLSLDRIGGRVTLGGTLGLGFEGGFEYYIEPRWLADGVVQLSNGVLEVGVGALDAGLDAGRDVGGDVVELGSAAVDFGLGAVDGALGAGGGALEKTVGRWFG
jgi:hypothetical protein